jgi:hypothetical protein
VGLTRYRSQDGQSLGGYLDTVLPKEIGWVNGHASG